MRDLYCFYDDNGSFSDFSFEAREYLKDTFDITMVALEDSIYIGLYKPFNTAYAELATANTNAGELTFSYYNGSSFVAVENQYDDTKGFNRSGFISWDKSSDWAATTINSQSAYWIKIDINADSSAMVFDGFNIVFSDDTDLEKEMRSINRFLSTNDSSFIAYHVSARDEIVQSIRNRGNVKKADGEDFYRNITAWDILDIGEIRQASKYLVLSKIMHDASDNPEDKYYQRFRDYRQMYGKSFDTWYLSLDKDDDGVSDTGEKLTSNTINLVRL